MKSPTPMASKAYKGRAGGAKSPISPSRLEPFTAPAVGVWVILNHANGSKSVVTLNPLRRKGFRSI